MLRRRLGTLALLLAVWAIPPGLDRAFGQEESPETEPAPAPAPEPDEEAEAAWEPEPDRGSGCGCRGREEPTTPGTPPPVPPAEDTDGDGFPDFEDACPTQAAPLGRSTPRPGCPVGDVDRDGVPDDQDRCLEEPEDYDGFQDDDGCPEGDNDGDGVLDPDDACPLDPGASADRGCPRAAPPVVTRPEPARPEPPRVDPPRVDPPRPEPKPVKPERPTGRVLATEEQRRWVIAVMNIEAPSDKKFPKDLLRGLTDQIRVFLASSKLKVVDRGQQDAAMKQILVEEKKKSYAQCVDASCQIPLGKVLAASHILRLTISRFGDVCTTSGELIDLTTEVTAAAATHRSGCGPQHLLDAAERLADELIRASQS